jgi:hypothetical protein
MPFHKERYPEDWKQISLRIRNRANWACECGGECGAHDGMCLALPGVPHPDTGAKVILTVAHLDHDPQNCDEKNLKAMCQRCHLCYDAKHHAKNAAITRRKKKIDAGQLEFAK